MYPLYSSPGRSSPGRASMAARGVLEESGAPITLSLVDTVAARRMLKQNRTA